jgi:hypothetical protein
MDEGFEGEHLREVTVENDRFQPDNDNENTTNMLFPSCYTQMFHDDRHFTHRKVVLLACGVATRHVEGRNVGTVMLVPKV